MLVSPFLLQVMEIKKNIRKFNGFAFDKVHLRVKLANFISDGLNYYSEMSKDFETLRWLKTV